MLSPLMITTAASDRLIHRKVLRFAQDDTKHDLHSTNDPSVTRYLA